jgi:hypothetical protein
MFWYCVVLFHQFSETTTFMRNTGDSVGKDSLKDLNICLGDIPSGNLLRSGRCSICRWSMVNFLLLMVISMIFHYHMIAKWDMIINTTPRIPETLWFLSEWTSFKEQKQIWLPRLPQKGVPPRDDVPSKIGVFQTWRNDNPFPIILNTLVGDFHIIGTIYKAFI